MRTTQKLPTLIGLGVPIQGGEQNVSKQFNMKNIPFLLRIHDTGLPFVSDCSKQFNMKNIPLWQGLHDTGAKGIPDPKQPKPLME